MTDNKDLLKVEQESEEAQQEQYKQKQKERLELAGYTLTAEQLEAYYAQPDIIEENSPPKTKPEFVGYKRCGKCGNIAKFALFNKNSSAKDKCTGTCGACQKLAAQKSYKKTKKKRNYKEYYRQNKEVKIAAAKKYYKENKEACDAKHREYVSSKKGKEVMRQAKMKRKEAMANNTGVPYTREAVIERDCRDQELPLCYLCGKTIEDVKDIHLDHVVGILIGGADCFTNVACVHSSCNLTKTKDCSEVTAQMVQDIVDLSETYMEVNPDLFD